MRVLYDGVQALGLTPCLAREHQGPIIVNVHAPDDPAWDLQRFVDALKRARRADQQFLQHAGPQLSRRLHRRHHA